MLNSSTLKLCFVFLASSLAATPRRSGGVKFCYTDATTFFNPKYVSMYSVVIRPQIPGTSMDLAYVVNVNYTKDPMTSFTLKALNKNKQYRTLIHVDYEYCAMVGTKLRSQKVELSVKSLLNYWILAARRNSEMPPCPIQAGRYELKDVSPDKKNIPPFMPSGSYRFESVNYFTDPREIIKNLTVSFDILKKN